jgi:GH15 family glucan-1,4-alpha-glucosidase
MRLQVRPVEEARMLFGRLLGLRNDLGLSAEEYDVDRHRQVGNFPQAFSHLTLIRAARTPDVVIVLQR